jgi:quinoprotein glucose dehydrogenase
LLWTFHTIPEKGELATTWLTPGSAEYTGNGGAWGPLAADPELGLVYLPVEGATSDMYGGERHGNNLFSCSLVALDVKTGQRVWHQQLVHHDIWDYDNPTSPILLDVNVNGRPVKAVVQLTKQAFAYAFDRATGEPLWPLEERPVPATDVPFEWTAATQPFPTKPAAYDRQGVDEDDLVDFTPAIKAAALESVKSLRMGPMYTPPSLIDAPDGTRGTLVLPHYGGGANWEGGAADPRPDAVRRIADEPDRVRRESGRRPIRHPLPVRERRGAATDGSAARETAVWTNHGDRHEQRRPPLDGRERRHSGRHQEQPGARGRHDSADRQG